MTPRVLLLVATLAANCALAALLVRSPGTPSSANPTTEAGQPATTSAKPRNAEARAKGQANSAAPVDPAPASPGFNWATIESDDFKKYIQNLRDLGVPDETIRDLIRAEVTKIYRPKMLALRPASNPEKYWERNFGGSFSQQSVEQRQQQTALFKEQSELLKTLLGETPMTGEHPLRRHFTSSPPEVVKQLIELQTKMNEKQAELYAKAGGYMDSSTMAERGKIEREFYTEVAKLTSPEQVEAYKLRNSSLSRNLRDELRAFEPTEEEFKAIFRQRDAANWDGVTRYDPANRSQLDKNSAVLAETLGPERAKEFELLSTSYEYRQLAESGVAKESLLLLAALKGTAETSARNIQRDTTLSPEQRTAALQAIRTETEKELATLLGERRAKAYPHNGGYWIRSLAPTVTTRVTAP